MKQTGTESSHMNKEQNDRRKYLLPIVNTHLGIPLLLVGKEETTMVHCLNVMMAELMKNVSPEELQFSIYDRAEALPRITQARLRLPVLQRQEPGRCLQQMVELRPEEPFVDKRAPCQGRP